MHLTLDFVKTRVTLQNVMQQKHLYQRPTLHQKLFHTLAAKPYIQLSLL